MNADAMATRMSVLSRALPLRILIVDDDNLELQAMVERLAGAGFEIEMAMNGREALEKFARQWFPIVITDWQMPVMDGIELTEQLRAGGADDTYVIMLTMRETSLDFERGYLAGVDDYLTKTLPDAELMARLHVAFNTLSLRRTLKETRVALEAATPLDLQSGAFTANESLIKLTSELRRAHRYGRQLAVMTVGVHSAGDGGAPKPEILHAAVTALRDVVRTHVDWVGRIEAAPDSATFAVVLPEAGPSDGPAIKARLSRVLAPFSEAAAAGERLIVEFGFASLDRGSGNDKLIDAQDLLAVAEQCRQCPGVACAQQLSTVQRSVATHVAISCRHGYAVDRNCTLKSQNGSAHPPGPPPGAMKN